MILFLAVALGELTAERLPVAGQPLELQAAATKSLPPNKRSRDITSGRKTNLPAPLTTFVGRTHELAQITQTAISHRLVTLTGAGGVGKSRLAMEAGIRMMWEGSQSTFPDGVWLVELAALTSGRMDSALVAQTIANIFKLSGGAER